MNSKLFTTFNQLPKLLYQIQQADSVPEPTLLCLNTPLLNDFGISVTKETIEAITSILCGNTIATNTQSLAQAYAGHQFGHFTLLGDGRALVLGDIKTTQNQVLEVQLKGSGATPYSRRGDGKATLPAMLREYLMSETLYQLKVPTNRSISVIATGEPVYREKTFPGAVLCRTAKSFVRVGTFEFLRAKGSKNDQEALLNYCIQRLYPQLSEVKNKALALLEMVMHQQIKLVSEWLRVGFIHGVMNTDNVLISCESMDFGPCAFLDVYHPQTVFSSIDTNGRYAFGNQGNIVLWNLSRFAESLLNLLHDDEKIAVELAQSVLNQYPALFDAAYYQMYAKKLGIKSFTENDKTLIDEWLNWLQTQQQDYTHSFLRLSYPNHFPKLPKDVAFNEWHQHWLKRISHELGGVEAALQLMQRNNPVHIPRNLSVDEALNTVITKGDLRPFNELLEKQQNPYQLSELYEKEIKDSYAEGFKTYCGT